MRLGFRKTDGGFVLYREKWGVLALGIALGGALTGFGACFYLLGAERGAPMLFVAPFSIAFALAGLVIWSRLPADARRWFAENGAVTLLVDAAGVEIASLPGAKRRRYGWGDLSEFALTGTLKSIDRDETGYSWNIIAIFFTSRPVAGANAFELAEKGIGRTGEGRAYMLVNYPRKQAAQIEDALRMLAPPSVKVTRYRRIVADHKKRVDRYEAA